MNLTGKVAFVSGASRGIGRAIASSLAQAGADVAINFNTHTEEAEHVAQLVVQAGRRALLCQGDVADLAAVEAMIANVELELGSVDIAVANAAYSDRAAFCEADLERFHRTVDVTMWGAFHVFRAAARNMIRKGQGGAIVGISSPHAFVPVADSMAYNMAKAALDQMAKTAALELAIHRIRVNLVYPGCTDTPGERNLTGGEELAKAEAKLVWGRLARPDEIARGVVFLCDPASDYITGSSLLIDGGFSLPWWTRRGPQSEKTT
ncbi:MAG: SDR family oxidoreductase [Planctomycetota bacterium]|nr:SDR family oxidoreductase [Planctomycetota bacterium]